MNETWLASGTCVIRVADGEKTADGKHHLNCRHYPRRKHAGLNTDWSRLTPMTKR